MLEAVRGGRRATAGDGQIVPDFIIARLVLYSARASGINEAGGVDDDRMYNIMPIEDCNPKIYAHHVTSSSLTHPTSFYL